MHGNRTLHPWLPPPDRYHNGECHRRLLLQQLVYSSSSASGNRPKCRLLPRAETPRGPGRQQGAQPGLSGDCKVSAAPPAASSGAGHTTLTCPDLCDMQPKNSPEPHAGDAVVSVSALRTVVKPHTGSTDSSSRAAGGRGPHGHAVEERNPKPCPPPHGNAYKVRWMPS